MTKTLLALSSVALAAALVGCGNGGPGGSTPTSTTANAHDQAVKFAQCMREHGIDMEDPKPGQGGFRIRAQEGSEAKMKEAQKACRALSPDQEGDGQMSAEELDRMTKLAQCLRRHGLDVKDPKPGQPFTIKSQKASGAKTEKAMKTCNAEAGMPDGPGSGGVAGSGSNG
jgi:hypothetical protein